MSDYSAAFDEDDGGTGDNIILVTDHRRVFNATGGVTQTNQVGQVGAIKLETAHGHTSIGEAGEVGVLLEVARSQANACNKGIRAHPNGADTKAIAAQAVNRQLTSGSTTSDVR